MCSPSISYLFNGGLRLEAILIVTGFLFGCRVCIEFQRFVIALHIIMNLFNRRIANFSFATSIFKCCYRLKSQSREIVSIIVDNALCHTVTQTTFS